MSDIEKRIILDGVTLIRRTNEGIKGINAAIADIYAALAGESGLAKTEYARPGDLLHLKEIRHPRSKTGGVGFLRIKIFQLTF